VRESKTVKVFLYATHQRCSAALLDLEEVRWRLACAGVKTVDRPGDADAIVLITCAFNAGREDESLRAIEEAHQKFPGRRIIVGGCLPAINPEAVRSVHGGDAFPTAGIAALAAALGAGGAGERAGIASCGVMEVPRPVSFRALGAAVSAAAAVHRRLRSVGLSSRGLNTVAGAGFLASGRTFLVRATEGCLGHCTYCVIRLARGRLKSSAPDEIVRSIRGAVTRGFREAALVGDDLAAYGTDIGTSLPALLDRIADIRPRPALYLENIHPRGLCDLRGALDPHLADGFIRYLDIPVQSGSDSILKAMGRPYPAAEAAREVRRLKDLFPAVVVSTHIMVGFPCESDDDFTATMVWLREARPDHVVVFEYTDRPGTPASKMAGKVPRPVRMRRYYTVWARARAMLAADFLRRAPR
jgi:tRNA A37 methylthiotransferase MiaB